MKHYEVEIVWTSTARGVSIYTVSAQDEEEAKALWQNGDRTVHIVVRDDGESWINSIKETR